MTGENCKKLWHCHFVYHKFHMDRPGIELWTFSVRSRRLAVWVTVWPVRKGDGKFGPAQFQGLIIFCVTENRTICCPVRHVVSLCNRENMENMLARFAVIMALIVFSPYLM
jgi:hypothetical protein